MIVHPKNPTLRLFEPNDVDQPEVRSIVEWASSYLMRPHPELGRTGPVCPYARGSLSRGTFYLDIVRGRPTKVDELVAAVRPFRDWFLELAPRELPESMFTAILILFPGVASYELIDAAQAELQQECVPDGLMVGEFHDGPPDKAGLWNPDWRPLRSPVPLLGIRQMVASDLPFLGDDPAFLAVHRELFGAAPC